MIGLDFPGIFYKNGPICDFKGNPKGYPEFRVLARKITRHYSMMTL